jgi:hypothetical protein
MPEKIELKLINIPEEIEHYSDEQLDALAEQLWERLFGDPDPASPTR